jgi:hypothetical protein
LMLSVVQMAGGEGSAANPVWKIKSVKRLGS